MLEGDDSWRNKHMVWYALADRTTNKIVDICPAIQYYLDELFEEEYILCKGLYPKKFVGTEIQIRNLFGLKIK